MNIFQRLFGRSPNAGAGGDDYTEPRLGLAFPVEMGGLQRRTKGRPYAEGNRQGESLAYGGNGVEATVYVTQVGQGEFPDGGDSEFIRAELESALAAVRELERMGHYRSVKLFTGDPERLGTDPRNLTWAKAAFFAVTSGGGPLVSFTYVTALGSNVIKLRMSSANPDNNTLKEFPHALGDLIGRQRPAAWRQ